ncbi:MAG: hypothetical protein P9L92_08285 [Candidatus Electryonea clarkiae]|nr:hypothetical protein [Candidatus Electryonea clarkiae]MDP8285319.1 hypothetical protein [Candidatus Electryonea clarkiae]
MKQASEKGIRLHVIIIEGKIFKQSTHYNQCVGVLSPPIDQLLNDELGLDFPHHLTQRVIDGYVLHGHNRSIKLDGHDVKSFATRRINFDEYLLEEARKKGAQVVHSRLTGLEMHNDYVRIYHESGDLKADVIVGAFGLDDGSERIFENNTTYRQPRYLYSILTIIHP